MAEICDVLGEDSNRMHSTIEVTEDERNKLQQWQFRICDPTTIDRTVQRSRELGGGLRRAKDISGYVRAYRLPLSDPPDQVGKVDFVVRGNGDI